MLFIDRIIDIFLTIYSYKDSLTFTISLYLYEVRVVISHLHIVKLNLTYLKFSVL